MDLKTKSYFLIAPTGDAYENLARDELILNELIPDSVVLYLYVNTGAVIIGRNQNPYMECDLERMDEDGVQLVRRVSGGGAVYHDAGNLNYSFIASEDIYDEARQTGVILKALETLGIRAQVSGRNDLTVNGLKFSGNAFAKRGHNRQHHGTLLISSRLDVFGRYLTPPKAKLQAKGIKSVRARVGNLNELVPGLTVERAAEALKAAFGTEYGYPQPYALNADQLARLSILRQKHASRDWLAGETPEFDITCEGRVSWGTVRLCLNVAHGAVQSCRVYSDSLDTEAPERISALLKGVRFEKEDLRKALALGGEEELAALF